MNEYIKPPYQVGFGDPAVTASCMADNPGWKAIVSHNTGLALGGVVAMVYDPSTAEFITTACNCHAAFMDACRAVLSAYKTSPNYPGTEAESEAMGLLWKAYQAAKYPLPKPRL